MRGAVVALCAGLVAATVAGCGSGNANPSTTTSRSKPFEVVFPEGFTRLDMALRVQAVARIARRERHHEVELSKWSYLAATKRTRVIPGFGPEKRPLEGFLFPDTYQFVRKTDSPTS